MASLHWAEGAGQTVLLSVTVNYKSNTHTCTSLPYTFPVPLAYAPSDRAVAPRCTRTRARQLDSAAVAHRRQWGKERTIVY